MIVTLLGFMIYIVPQGCLLSVAINTDTRIQGENEIQSPKLFIGNLSIMHRVVIG